MTFWNAAVTNFKISGLKVDTTPWVVDVNGGSGTIPTDNVVVTNLQNAGGIHSCANLRFQDAGGNSGWNLSYESQKC